MAPVFTLPLFTCSVFESYRISSVFPVENKVSNVSPLSISVPSSLCGNLPTSFKVVSHYTLGFNAGGMWI